MAILLTTFYPSQCSLRPVSIKPRFSERKVSSISPFLELRVNTRLARLLMRRVQPASITLEVKQLHSVAEYIEEFFHGRRVVGIAEELFFSRLPELLVDNAEFEAVAYYVLVVVQNHVAGTCNTLSFQNAFH